MALAELLAALRQQAGLEAADLRDRAASEVTAIRGAAAAAAARGREDALAAERRRLAAKEATAVAAARADELVAELAAREALLVRAAAALQQIAAAAELELSPATLGRLLADGRRYLPPAPPPVVRCPPALVAAVRGAACALGIAVELAEAGDPLALVSGAWRVEVGLPALAASRWPELAPRVLAALEQP